MNKFYSLLFLFIIVSDQVKSQRLPEEGSVLNYRLIGVSFPAVSKVNRYTIEIAIGNYNTEDSFKKNIIKQYNSDNNELIVDVPAFGTKYTWRVSYTAKSQSKMKYSKLHHFSVSTSQNIDTSVMRFRILDSAKTYRDGFVFLDGNRALYDMNGLPIWFLPEIDGLDYERVFVRDLKLTSQGTITFIVDDVGAYEINYKGDVLWKTPGKDEGKGDSDKHYHHEFTKLANGNYMILGTEFTRNKLPSPKDTMMRTPIEKMGTIMEYNKLGKIIWSWRSSMYFNASEHQYQKNIPGKRWIPDIHENSFFFDENTKTIYLSFRDINRVLKVKYPDGYVMNSFGETFKSLSSGSDNFMFCSQHSCRRSQKGYLYLYDNNICNYPALPKVMMMEEPASGNDTLKKIWEYQCTTEGMNVTKTDTSRITIGGNVLELPNQSIFVSMSVPYSKVFIVNLNKEILWCALPEKYNKEDNKWYPFPEYRASIITNRKDLERLIWNGETGKMAGK